MKLLLWVGWIKQLNGIEDGSVMGQGRFQFKSMVVMDITNYVGGGGGQPT